MTQHTPTPDLPELSDETISRIEAAVFDEIAEEREPARRAAERARSRRRDWLTGVGVAAAFAAGVLVTPPILGVVGAGSATSTADGGMLPSTTVPESFSGLQQSDPGSAGDVPSTVRTEAADADRVIVTTARATVRVGDIAAAVDAVTALATQHGGYVESTDVGRSFAADDTTVPVPQESPYGWVGVRIPTAGLDAFIEALGGTGEVLSSSTSWQDVASAAIDLRARVDATRASVQRLTELMAQSGSVSDLIEAEVALSDRQAQLESYEQQLASLEEQVSMSSVQVELTRTAQATPDPAGFGDGIAAGWNGLIVALNALVVAVGFILPWLGIAALIVLFVWLLRRARRRRREAEDSAAEATED